MQEHEIKTGLVFIVIIALIILGAVMVSTAV